MAVGFLCQWKGPVWRVWRMQHPSLRRGYWRHDTGGSRREGGSDTATRVPEHLRADRHPRSLLRKRQGQRRTRRPSHLEARRHWRGGSDELRRSVEPEAFELRHVPCVRRPRRGRRKAAREAGEGVGLRATWYRHHRRAAAPVRDMEGLRGPPAVRAKVTGTSRPGCAEGGPARRASAVASPALLLRWDDKEAQRLPRGRRGPAAGPPALVWRGWTVRRPPVASATIHDHPHPRPPHGDQPPIEVMLSLLHDDQAWPRRGGALALRRSDLITESRGEGLKPRDRLQPGSVCPVSLSGALLQGGHFFSCIWVEPGPDALGGAAHDQAHFVLHCGRGSSARARPLELGGPKPVSCPWRVVEIMPFSAFPSVSFPRGAPSVGAPA
jgi:hypothetical protein